MLSNDTAHNQVLSALPPDVSDPEMRFAPTATNNMQTGELLDAAKVMDILKADIPDILHGEPNWAVFADDFKVIDQTGATVEGLSNNKMLLKLFRRTYKKFALNDDIVVNFINESLIEAPAFIVGRWKFKFGSDRPLLHFWEEDNHVDFEVETTFHLNDKSQLDSLRVDQFLLNGLLFPAMLQLWPDVSSRDDRATSMIKIKEFEKKIRQLEALKPTAVESMKAFVPSRRDILSQAAVQTGLQIGLLYFLGKGEYDRRTAIPEPLLEPQEDSFDAIESVKAFIPDIFKLEPEWEYFAEDVQTIDESGVALNGLDVHKLFFQLLREFHNQLAFTPLKDYYTVHIERTSEQNPDGSREHFLVARWNFEINLQPRLPVFNARWDFETTLEAQVLSRLKNSFPVAMGGRCTFKFNQDQKLSVVYIDDYSLNRGQFKLPLDILEGHREGSAF